MKFAGFGHKMSPGLTAEVVITTNKRKAKKCGVLIIYLQQDYIANNKNQKINENKNIADIILPLNQLLPYDLSFYCFFVCLIFSFLFLLCLNLENFIPLLPKVFHECRLKNSCYSFFDVLSGSMEHVRINS